MSITAATIRVTRGIHRAACHIHKHGLRMAVKAAKRRTRKADEAATIASAFAEEAGRLAVKAHLHADKVGQTNYLLEKIARQEASSIGVEL